ncbi:MAG: hypothetical protein QOF48_3510 [Verrucomicrobiota bacterium]|jgi:hypothetical protein
MALMTLGCIAGMIVSMDRLKKERRENQRLKEQCQDLQQRLDEAGAGNFGSAPKAAPALDHGEKTELLRLRNQAAQLRNATNELQRLQKASGELSAENRRLRDERAALAVAASEPSTTAAVFSKAEWRFAGYATPESTFQSAVWAMNNGEPEIFLKTLTPDERARMEGEWRNRPLDEVRRESQDKMQEVTGYRILARRAIDDGRVGLTIFAEGKGDSVEVLFQRIGEEWKFAGKSRRPPAAGQ